jgi:UDP-N-acetylglucosamine/UDP-N-acetylgalactosamine diphosphorylase
MEEHVARFVASVRERGVIVHAPQTLAVGAEVRPERFERGAVLHAGTRLRGARTLVLAGAELGAEAPLTLVDAQVGRGAKLKGGYVEEAVFLSRSELGSAAHVRGGTLFEEEAYAAHAVGLKQTILMPFATLGSLINFCDCLLAGGTSRRDHSEVGSSFIHFNFTPRGPRGDKATPSLFGDVPRGVRLDQPRIFLGGDGGVVGPLHVDYGSVLAAGSTYRRDVPPGVLRTADSLAPEDLPFDPLLYGDVRRKWRLNVQFLGNLAALRAWYHAVRLPGVPAGDELARELVQAAADVVETCVRERRARLWQFVEALDVSLARLPAPASAEARRSQTAARDAWPRVAAWLDQRQPAAADGAARERFLDAWARTELAADHLSRVRALPDAAREAATTWLQGIVDGVLQAGRLDA